MGKAGISKSVSSISLSMLPGAVIEKAALGAMVAVREGAGKGKAGTVEIDAGSGGQRR